MITLALFEKMATDEVAGLVRNDGFYWEEAPLQQNGKPASGVWLVTRGGSAQNSPKGLNLRTTVDFYVAYKNKIKTEKTHLAILNWLIANRGICEMSGQVYGESYEFHNIRINPVQTPQNDGVTENGLIVKVASAEIIYDLHSI